MANIQTAIEKILEAHNQLTDFHTSSEFYAKFTKPDFDPLVIERLGERVVVGHYFIQNGDVMADPEIVFDYATWAPLELTQNPLGVYRSKFRYRGGVQFIDPCFDAAVLPLVQLWANNLIHQGWTTAAIERDE